jgi:hypothetical protein
LCCRPFIADEPLEITYRYWDGTSHQQKIQTSNFQPKKLRPYFSLATLDALTWCRLPFIADEPLEITYSYWDGTGHRRKIQVRKGDSIGEFMKAVQVQLAPEFREVRTTMYDNLMYVKEDLIIPHVSLSQSR